MTLSSPSLKNLGVGVFATVMGIAGLATAWNRLHASFAAVPSWIGAGLAWTGFGLLVILAAIYAVKTARFPGAVATEWTHPVSGAFGATAPIGALIVAVALTPHAPVLARATWWVGAVGIAIVTVMTVRGWIHNAQVEHAHIHPAWFIPVVGNIVAPSAGASHAPSAFVWYLFGVGLVYWVALLPVVLGRLFIAGTLPQRLVPTLAILVAPPAVASISWVALGGTWTDPLARALTAVTLFQLALLASQASVLTKTPFALPSWAYTFPLAAAAVALMAAGANSAGQALTWAGVAVAATATGVVAALAVKTVKGFADGSLLQAH